MTTANAAAAATATAAGVAEIAATPGAAGRRHPGSRHGAGVGRADPEGRFGVERGAEAVEAMKNDLDHEGDQRENETEEGNEKGSVDIWEGGREKE